MGSPKVPGKNPRPPGDARRTPDAPAGPMKLRGMWLVDPALVLPLNRFLAEVRVPARLKPLKHLQTVHPHLGTADPVAWVALLDRQEVGPGEAGLAEALVLARQGLFPGGARTNLKAYAGRIEFAPALEEWQRLLLTAPPPRADC